MLLLSLLHFSRNLTSFPRNHRRRAVPSYPVGQRIHRPLLVNWAQHFSRRLSFSDPLSWSVWVPVSLFSGRNGEFIWMTNGDLGNWNAHFISQKIPKWKFISHFITGLYNAQISITRGEACMGICNQKRVAQTPFSASPFLPGQMCCRNSQFYSTRLVKSQLHWLFR